MPKQIKTMNVISNSYEETRIFPASQNDHQLRRRIYSFEEIKKISEETHSVLYNYNRNNLSKFFTYDENICLFDYFMQKVSKVMAQGGLFETYLRTGVEPTIEKQPFFIQKQGKKVDNQLEDENPSEEIKNDDDSLIESLFAHELIEINQDLNDEAVRTVYNHQFQILQD